GHRGTRPPSRHHRSTLGETHRDVARPAGGQALTAVDADHLSRQPLLDALGVALPDDLLTLALTHRSYAYEHGGLPTNERLEFLGDAVLELTVTAEIFRRYPDRSEGELAKLKSAVVNTQALAEIAR